MYFSWQTTDRQVEVIIMLAQLLDVAVVEPGAELGNIQIH